MELTKEQQKLLDRYLTDENFFEGYGYGMT